VLAWRAEASAGSKPWTVVADGPRNRLSKALVTWPRLGPVTLWAELQAVVGAALLNNTAANNNGNRRSKRGSSNDGPMVDTAGSQTPVPGGPGLGGDRNLHFGPGKMANCPETLYAASKSLPRPRWASATIAIIAIGPTIANKARGRMSTTTCTDRHLAAEGGFGGRRRPRPARWLRGLGRR